MRELTEIRQVMVVPNANPGVTFTHDKPPIHVAMKESDTATVKLEDIDNATAADLAHESTLKIVGRSPAIERSPLLSGADRIE